MVPGCWKKRYVHICYRCLICIILLLSSWVPCTYTGQALGLVSTITWTVLFSSHMWCYTNWICYRLILIFSKVVTYVTKKGLFMWSWKCALRLQKVRGKIYSVFELGELPVSDGEPGRNRVYEIGMRGSSLYPYKPRGDKVGGTSTANGRNLTSYRSGLIVCLLNVYLHYKYDPIIACDVVEKWVSCSFLSSLFIFEDDDFFCRMWVPPSLSCPLSHR